MTIINAKTKFDEPVTEEVLRKAIERGVENRAEIEVSAKEYRELLGQERAELDELTRDLAAAPKMREDVSLWEEQRELILRVGAYEAAYHSFPDELSKAASSYVCRFYDARALTEPELVGQEELAILDGALKVVKEINVRIARSRR